MENTEPIEIDMDFETYNFLLDYAKKNGIEYEDEDELVNWSAVKLLTEYMDDKKSAKVAPPKPVGPPVEYLREDEDYTHRRKS